MLQDESAIATVQSNNIDRLKEGQPTLDSMTIPCIAFSGTVSALYLVPVTKELSDAVSTGQYPAAQTCVSKCATTAAHQDGMVDPEFRKLAFQRFLAFMPIEKRHWGEFYRFLKRYEARCHISQLALQFRRRPFVYSVDYCQCPPARLHKRL